jgi:chromosome segregation ATPase
VSRAKEMESAAAVEEVRTLRARLEEDRRERDVALKSAEEEKSVLRTQLDDLRQEHKTRVAATVQQVGALKSELEEISAARTTTSQASATELASLRSELEASLVIGSSLPTALASIATLERQLAETTQQLSSLSETRDEDAMKLARLESELSVKTQRVESLNKQLLDAATVTTSTALGPTTPSSPRRGITASPSIAEGLNLHHSGSLRERSGRVIGTSELPYTPSSRMEAVSEEREEIGRCEYPQRE